MKNIKEIIALICCCNLVFPVPMAIAAPQGGKVVGGSAHIHQSGATTTINQSSNRAVINWNSFDIGKNETVRHNMPSANSAGLHRVVGGGGASQIMGQLQSNGNVYLVNPAGVVIHKGARIDANSFTATSRDISNDNFMKGTMVFDKPGRPDAEVINQGTISVKENGLAALVAPTVRNDGVIAGKLAKVALASGDSTWKLDMHGDDLITFTVDEKDVDTLHAVDGTPLAGVENSGSIKAEGGVVVLTAAQLDGIVGSVVNSGEVSAASAELKGGKIVFKGAGSGVDIVNTGTVDASSAVADGGSVRMDTDGKVRSSGLIAATGGQKGGKLVVTGKDVALTGKAKIDVSGNKGGGTALVGGNALGKGPERNAQTTKVEKDATIVADARTKGDGGQVVVWSDEKTNFDGTITARGGSDGGNGGKVETSGKSLKVADTAQVDTRASKGIHGQWLLDPMDFVIAASDGDMTGEALSANLETGNVRIESANGVRDGHGDIFVNSSVSWDADNTLSLDAERNIYINADITATGDHAGLNLLPAGDYMLGDAKITLSGADPRLSIKGESYVVIHDVNELKNINRITAFDNNYALGVDIDASSAEDFTGIGLDTGFSGIFDGMGHTIESLRIKDDYDIFEQGFFTAINSNGIVRNLVLSNVSVLGGHVWAGAIAGSSDGYIHHVSVTGQVEGDMSAGGIVGVNRGVIEQAFSSADVSCTIGGGGVVGENTAGATISYSGSSGSICGDRVGGFAGGNKGKISFSYSSGIVEEAAINSGNSNGGFVGMNSGIIANSYSLSDIRADSGNRAWGTGGFAGELLGGTLDRVYWSGTISSKDGKPIGSHVGAIVGYISKRWNEDIVNISASYGLDSGCPPDQSGVEYENVHGIGKLELASGEYYIYSGLLTTEQMKSQTSFQGWDFENIWAIDEGQSSPYLRPVAITVPGPSPDPDPTPTPDPDPTPTPDPDPEPAPNPGIDPAPMPNPKPNYSTPDSYINSESGIEPASGKQSGIVLTQDEEYRRKLQASYDSFESSFRKEFGEKFYNVVDDKNNKHENALEKFKSEIMFSSMYYDKKGNIIHAPDAVYEFIAKTVVDILGESKINKYANDYEGFIKQLNKYLTDINFYKEMTIDGVTYSIDNAGFALSGAGLSDCVISWKINGKKYSVRMDWVSSPEDSMKALAEYCLALVEINKTAWEDAASYFLTGKPGASKYFSIGGDVIAALAGKPAANALVKKIGGAFAEEYTTGWFGNKFKTFVKEQIAGGADFIAAAEAINDIRVAYDNVMQAIEAGKNYSRYENDILAACDVLDSIDGFSSESLRTFRRDFEIDKVERN